MTGSADNSVPPVTAVASCFIWRLIRVTGKYLRASFSPQHSWRAAVTLVTHHHTRNGPYIHLQDTHALALIQVCGVPRLSAASSLSANHSGGQGTISHQRQEGLALIIITLCLASKFKQERKHNVW